MSEVNLTAITKKFGDFVAVNEIDLEVEDGAFTVLVGPSGCGKTTTLRMIAGLEEATSGEIRIGEKVVNRVPPKDRDIAMVFQNYALYPHMDVYNNMAFGLKLRKTPKKEIDQRVHDAADLLGIGEKLKSKPRE
ncbi:ABC transporter ATP-binding protein, partial [Candidatus Bipolaricaulota bacterium]|nr:ABC transporter ATP-binding protein [Candidatus Bipolaricaulota bacterium]